MSMGRSTSQPHGARPLPSLAKRDPSCTPTDCTTTKFAAAGAGAPELLWARAGELRPLFAADHAVAM